MLWTLILSMSIVTMDGTSTHSITVPNLPTKEICQDAGKQHVQKYENTRILESSRSNYILRHASFAAVYTCVEQGKF